MLIFCSIEQIHNQTSYIDLSIKQNVSMKCYANKTRSHYILNITPETINNVKNIFLFKGDRLYAHIDTDTNNITELSFVWVPIFSNQMNVNNVSIKEFIKFIVDIDIEDFTFNIEHMDEAVIKCKNNIIVPSRIEDIETIVKMKHRKKELVNKFCNQFVKRWYKYRILRSLIGLSIDIDFDEKLITSIKQINIIAITKPLSLFYCEEDKMIELAKSLGIHYTLEDEAIGIWRRELWKLFNSNITYATPSEFETIIKKNIRRFKTEQIPTYIQNAIKDNLLSVNDGNYYLPEVLKLETELKKYIKIFKSSPHYQYQFNTYNNIDNNNLIEKLTTEQIEAINNSINNPISLLIGPAGSGKSTITALTVGEMNKLGMRVCLTSFTGKAVNRLKEICIENKIEFNHASTIDMLLTTQQFNFDAFIVDEVSMLNLVLLKYFLHRLLLHKDLKTEKYLLPRLLFIGDENQLPPISCGCAIDALMNCLPVSRLSRVHRQLNREGNKYNVSYASTAVLADKLDVLKFSEFKENETGVFTTKIKNIKQVIQQYNHLISIYDPCEVAILTYKNVDVNLINNEILKQVNTEQYREFKIGCPVMMIRNNYDQGLVNGSIGKVVSISNKGLNVEFNGIVKEFKFFGSKKKKKQLTINDLKICYAFTIHKSQGSEWKAIIFYCGEIPGIMNKELLYVAFSRAREVLSICGYQPEVINVFARNSTKKIRKNGL